MADLIDNKDYNEVFELEMENIDKDNLSIFIIEKLLDEKTSFQYILDCHVRAKKIEKYELINLSESYLITYIRGLLDENHSEKFLEWLSKNKFDYWNILIDDYINNNKNELISFFNNIINSQKFSDYKIKFHNIGEILKHHEIQNIIKYKTSNKITSGKEEEEKGLLCWIKKIPHDMKIDECYDAIIPLVKNKDLYKIVLTYIHTLLNYNSSYTKLYNTEEKKTCCTEIFLLTLYQIMLKSLDIYEIKKDKVYEYFYKNNKLEIRKEYEIKKNDSLEVILMMTLFKMHNTIYLNLFSSYYTLKSNYNNMNIPSFLFQINNKEKQIIKAKMDIIYRLISHKETNIAIIKLFENYFEMNILINPTIINDYLYLWQDMSSALEDYYISPKNISIIVKMIDTRISTDKAQRIDAAINLTRFGEYYPFNEMNNEVLYALLKYINDVNPHDLLKASQYYTHIKSCYGLISKLTKVVNKTESKSLNFGNYIETRKVDFGVESEFVVFNAIHKICSKAIGILEDIIKEEKIIKSNPNDPMNNPAILKIELDRWIDIMLKTLYNCTICIYDLISNLINSIEKIEPVLISPIVTLTVDLIVYFSKGNNIVYSIFEKNMEALDILQITFKIINLVKLNTSFKKEINQHLETLKIMVDRVKMENNIKNEIKEYINKFNLETDEIPDDEYPDEFIDSLLSVPIKDPVMLPNVKDTYFDKNSIISQLFYNKVNPYTNEPLTIEEFEKFNKKEEIIESINNFKYKLNQWRNEKLKKVNIL